MRIAFVGAGAVGAPAALMAAMAAPQHEVTVFDDGSKAPAHRTFVLLCGTCDTLRDLGAWEPIGGSAHRISTARTDFQNSFGALSLAGDDCDADAVGHSIDEKAMVGAMRKALAGQENVTLLDGASVTGTRPDGEVAWTRDGSESSDRFELVAIAGLPKARLVEAGFAFEQKDYAHQAIVSTVRTEGTTDVARERMLRSGAVTLVPRGDGFGHILMLPDDLASELSALEGDAYLSRLEKNRWLPPPGPRARIVARGTFRPRQRVATNPGLGRVALLGASACTVHPIGAPELNLGLRDAAALADTLGNLPGNAKGEGLAERFARSRKRDRSGVARSVDLAAEFAMAKVPGKLCAAGLAATAIDLLPPARRAALALAALRR